MTASSIPPRPPPPLGADAPAWAAPGLQLPHAGLFAARALRLRQRAAGHAMGAYLLFAAEIAQRQHELLGQGRELPLPDEGHLATAAASGEPPLPAARWPRHPAWRADLQALLLALAGAPIPSLARELADQLAHASDTHLEQQAQALLDGGGARLDAGSAPLIGAALQLYWTRLVLRLQARHQALLQAHDLSHLAPFGLIDDPGACPCCGSGPVAAVILHGACRHLACHLCGTQWRCADGLCSHCRSLPPAPGLGRLGLPGDEGQPSGEGAQAVRLEVCEPCGHYLKVVHLDLDPQAEPLADDLASHALDLLASQRGLQRHGFNPLLQFGEARPGR